MNQLLGLNGAVVAQLVGIKSGQWKATDAARDVAGDSSLEATSTTVKARLRILIGTAVAGIVVLLALLVHDISAVYKAADLANEDTIPSIEALAAADRQIREALLEYDHARDNVLQLSRAGQKDAARELLWTSLPTIDKLV